MLHLGHAFCHRHNVAANYCSAFMQVVHAVCAELADMCPIAIFSIILAIGGDWLGVRDSQNIENTKLKGLACNFVACFAMPHKDEASTLFAQ